MKLCIRKLAACVVALAMLLALCPMMGSAYSLDKSVLPVNQQSAAGGSDIGRIVINL